MIYREMASFLVSCLYFVLYTIIYDVIMPYNSNILAFFHSLLMLQYVKIDDPCLIDMIILQNVSNGTYMVCTCNESKPFFLV